MEHQFEACGNSCKVFGELVLDEETSTLFLALYAKCFHLSMKLFSHPFFNVTHNSTKKVTLHAFKRENTVIPVRKYWAGRTIVHPTAHLSISSRLLASVEALPSFAVPTRYESHVLSLGFVKWRGQFPLSNCSLSSCEKNAKSGEELKIIIIFLELF